MKFDKVKEHILSKNKGEFLESIKELFKYYKNKEKREEDWSDEKQISILNMIKKFEDAVRNTELPPLSGDWYFFYKMIEDGIQLHLGRFVEFQVLEDFVLLYIKCTYLSVEEYAQKYSVTVTTVRQWIRRGKLRSAIKLGRNWLIPELADKPRRGYEPVTYRWEYISDELVKNFPYLSKCCSLRIMQDRYDKKIFKIVLRNKDEEMMYRLEMTKKEIEKLELALISESNVSHSHIVKQ